MLVASAEMDADDLARTELSTRSGGAITVVRQGIKLHASGQDTQGILSRMMIHFLEKRPSITQWAAHQHV